MSDISQDLERINAMTYEDMIRLVRFAPVGHPYFVAGTPLCEAFEEHFERLRDELPVEAHVTASKRVGWGS